MADLGGPTEHREPAEMVTLPRAVVDEVIGALGQAWKITVACKGSLTEPYRDDPRWSPWTRWFEPMARRAFEARDALMKEARRG